MTMDEAVQIGIHTKRSAVAVVPFAFSLSIFFHLLAFLGGTVPVDLVKAAQMQGARIGDGLRDAMKVRTSCIPCARVTCKCQT